MSLSSALCQAQEKIQRERAATTRLPNIRRAAIAAADAWKKLAVDAKKREARRERSRILAAERAAEKQAAMADPDEQPESPPAISAEHRLQ